jgi:hypothetical protein
VRFPGGARSLSEPLFFSEPGLFYPFLKNYEKACQNDPPMFRRACRRMDGACGTFFASD